jgi:hypothetical protein
MWRDGSKKVDFGQRQCGSGRCDNRGMRLGRSANRRSACSEELWSASLEFSRRLLYQSASRRDIFPSSELRDVWLSVLTSIRTSLSASRLIFVFFLSSPLLSAGGLSFSLPVDFGAALQSE